MADFSDYLENAIINHFLRNTAQTSPTTVYVALFTTATADDGTGTEVTGGSYARQSVTFDAPANGVTQNGGAAVEFTNMPTATVTHFAIYDAVSAGNMLYHSALNTSRSFTSGDTATFAINAITVTNT